MPDMPFSLSVLRLAVAGLLFAGGASGFCAEQPNVLIIMADDCTYNDLPLYGGKNARTPNIDALAAEGLTFDRAYLSEAMCQPCRAELYTGQFPLRNGCAWNHSASRSDTLSLPDLLGPAGYRVGLAGKVHVKPDDAFPFENVPGFDPNCVRNPTQTCSLSGVEAFMSRAADPFCLVVALVEPHVPWVMGDASQYPEDQIKLPPNIADTARTREAFSRYLAEITYMDDQVGQILATLERSGKAKDTLVLFTSEQGSQFPGCKWTNWDTGLHTALIARWPGKVPAGERSDAIVQYADVVPTLLEVANVGEQRSEFDGTSFLGVLTGETDRHRSFAYGLHNNLPEGPSYPIRTITDGDYRYIENLRSDEIYIEKHLMGIQGNGRLNNPYWQTWIGEAWQNETVYDLVKRYVQRPPVQLYHTAGDPFELRNLAGNEEQRPVEERLREELHRWMTAQGDPGAPEDTREALQAARRDRHLYGPDQQPR